MSARGAWLWALLVCVACGPPAPPNPGGEAPGLEQPCAMSGEACQPGLVCGASGLCEWSRCVDATDPRGWCAAKLGVDAARASCEPDGSCVVLRSGVDEPCEADAGCHFGLVCEQARCVTLCTSSATCPGADRACVARALGAEEKICGPLPACGDVAEPGAFCADLLGVAQRKARCGDDGRCELLKSPLGSYCERDLECVAGAVCEDRWCVALCEGDASCDDPQLSCAARLSGGEGTICRYVPKGCEATPDPVAYCESERGFGSQCEAGTGECLEPPPPIQRYDGLVIRDSSRPESCSARTPEGLHEPGADLVSVEVYDASGARLLAYMDNVMWERGTGEENNFVEPDLEAASLRAYRGGINAPVCPLRREGDERLELHSMLSLGCGGEAQISFRETDFAWTNGLWSGALETGMRVRVGEYAPVCDGDDNRVDVDAYVVKLCGYSPQFPDWSCFIPLSAGAVSGTQWFVVP